jgi:hypothetical protein
MVKVRLFIYTTMFLDQISRIKLSVRQNKSTDDQETQHDEGRVIVSNYGVIVFLRYIYLNYGISINLKKTTSYMGLHLLPFIKIIIVIGGNLPSLLIASLLMVQCLKALQSEQSSMMKGWDFGLQLFCCQQYRNRAAFHLQ